MKPVIDEQVGLLWAKYYPWSGLHGIELHAAKDVVSLILRLIEEWADRQQAILESFDKGPDYHQACVAFDILYDEYLAVKGDD